MSEEKKKHQELVEKVDSLYFIHNKPVEVVLAILELHQPIGDIFPSCGACESDDRDVKYPCDTIVTIEAVMRSE